MNSYQYKQIERHVMGLVESQTLRPGDRLPSLRQMGKAMDVSVPTVAQAYTELESRGVVESRERSGFFVRADYSPLPACPELPDMVTVPGPSLSRPELVKAVEACCCGVAQDYLGTCYLDESLMGGAALARVLRSVLQDDPSLAVLPSERRGYAELRKQIALRSMDAGAAVSHEDVIITTGAMSSIACILRVLTRPGDTILVQSPTFIIYMHLMEMLGLRAIELPSCPNNGISVDTVADIVRDYDIRACLLIPNFHLDGSVIPDENKERLVEVLDEAGVPLIEDDVYGDLHFGETRPTLCKKWDSTGNVVTASSFSKTIGPGYSIGWLIPGRFMEQAAHMHRLSFVRPAMPAQMALAEFLRRGDYQRHMRKTRAALDAAMSRMHCAISRAFPEGTSANRPTGGLHFWIRLPDTVDSKDVFLRAREERVTIIPGCVQSSTDTFRNYIRINCRGVWNTEIQNAVDTLGRIVTELAGL